MPKSELVKFVSELAELERQLVTYGPQTDDELHAWIKQTLGVDIPRTAVCEGHDAPFTFFADAYFGRTVSALVMANRGGSKTFLVALLHLALAHFKAGYEGTTVGAIEQQALRCYQHLTKQLDKNDDLKAQVAGSIMRETRWKNGSRVEVLPGTIAAVNGPHPNLVHADEVDLMDEEVFDESRNMSASGRGIPAQDIITSTRKWIHGLMQRLKDECADARANGFKPAYDEYTWCVFEAAQPVGNCQVANPHLDEAHRCECDKVVKARWDNGQPRRFSDVCGGRLARSGGWIPLADIHKTFTADSRDIWEAQQECSKPSTEGLVLPRFSLERYGIRQFDPDPQQGPIFCGIDFGGTNPHAAIWFQLLRYEVEAVGLRGTMIRMPEGSVVAFDEFYKAEVGNNRLADAIIERERYWAKQYPGFRVTRRFADPQGKAARLDLIAHDPPVRTSFVTTRDVKEHIKVLVNLIDDERLYVHVGRCKMWCEEIGAWHYPKKRPGLIDDPDKPVEDFDHAMAATRYGVCNLLQMVKRGIGQSRGVPNADTTRAHSPLPVSGVRSPRASVRRYSGGAGSPVGIRSRQGG